jgi:NADH:ubiquinone oxidoreductase subunit C
MLQDLIVIEKDQIIDEVAKVKKDGYRLVTITCENDGENFEFTYHFDLNYGMKNIRFATAAGENVKSISNIYKSAFLIENEIQDLFGIDFEDLSVNYKGRLYLAEDGPKAPMVKTVLKNSQERK